MSVNRMMGGRERLGLWGKWKLSSRKLWRTPKIRTRMPGK